MVKPTYGGNKIHVAAQNIFGFGAGIQGFRN